MTFTSLDFETANRSEASICAAGLSVFGDGELVESPYWLVRPPKGHGWFLEEFTVNCHGLTWFDVQDADEFPAVATELLPRLAQADLVIAHNAEFDMRHLRGTLRHFGLTCPGFEYACTMKLARRVWPGLPNHQLPTLAAHVGCELQHHQARSDAEAAARVFCAMMKTVGASKPRDLLEATGLAAVRFSP